MNFTTPNSCFVHTALPTQTVWVYEDVFYNLQTHHDRWVKAKLFGLSCLPHRVPCFEIITSEGHVFSDIPPHLIRFSDPLLNPPETPYYELSDLVYNNCLSESFCLVSFDELSCRYAHVYLKRLEQYVTGRYLFSLDFHHHNNWYHAIVLSQGQIAFIPSHKLTFSPSPIPPHDPLPAYQKLRTTFHV